MPLQINDPVVIIGPTAGGSDFNKGAIGRIGEIAHQEPTYGINSIHYPASSLRKLEPEELAGLLNPEGRDGKLRSYQLEKNDEFDDRLKNIEEHIKCLMPAISDSHVESHEKWRARTIELEGRIEQLEAKADYRAKDISGIKEWMAKQIEAKTDPFCRYSAWEIGKALGSWANHKQCVELTDERKAVILSAIDAFRMLNGFGHRFDENIEILQKMLEEVS